MKRYEKEDMQEAVNCLNNNGVILYPTDTIWGLGCKMTDKEAFEKIFELKGRDKSKKCILLFSSEVQLERSFEEIPEVAWQLMECSDKPMTLILEKPKTIPAHLLAEDGTIAVRLVKDIFCEHLIQKIKEPIVSTSANISGNKSPQNFKQVESKIVDGVDYVVKFRQDENEKANASTIIKLNNDGEIKVIRE
jgi:L-threonylcarbamoyladenylate synthase